MKCPACGYSNIPGTDECESCHEDLASIDGLVPKTKIEKVLMNDPISRLQPRQPVIVKKEINLLQAVKIMNAAKIGCALVGANGELEGILTERDVVFKALSQEKDLSKIPVGQVMTAKPESLSENDTLAFAVNKMAVGGFRHIPILRGGKPVGVISVRDVLRYLSKLFP